VAGPLHVPGRGVQGLTPFLPYGARCVWFELPLPHASLASSLQQVAEVLQLRAQSLVEFQYREPLRTFPLEATGGALGGVKEPNQCLQVQVTQVQITAVGLRTSGEKPPSPTCPPRPSRWRLRRMAA
jgi:hypothetical protein